MKKNLFVLASAAVALSVATSCSNSDDVYNPNAANEAKLAEYNQKFVEEFGTPAADQDWGFGSSRAMTRGVNANANQWWKNYTIPETVTEDEITYVSNWFKTHQYPESTTITSPCTFFAQQVYRGSNKYKDGTGAEVEFSVSNLNCGDSNGGYNCCIANNGQIDERDVYKYNNDPNNGTFDRKECIALIEDGNPNKWQYTSTKCGTAISSVNVIPKTKSLWDNNGNLISQAEGATETYKYNVYVLVAIKYNGKTNYYVGLDLAANGSNKNEQVSPDGYFDDMIIKITPISTSTETEVTTTRVFAEDLGTIGDWDFNDVVFDVRSDDKVIIQAAGGTLPIYLKWNGNVQEVHAAFGEATNKVINVHGSGSNAIDGKDPVELDWKFTGEAGDIQIIVVENGTEREITAFTGQPAAKLAVKKDIEWLSEGQHITSKYPKFEYYVSNPNLADTWYLNE